MAATIPNNTNAVPFPQYHSATKRVEEKREKLSSLRTESCKVLGELVKEQRQAWEVEEKVLKRKFSWGEQARVWREDNQKAVIEEARLVEEVRSAKKRLVEVKRSLEVVRGEVEKQRSVWELKEELERTSERLRRLEEEREVLRGEVKVKEVVVRKREGLLEDRLLGLGEVKKERGELKREKEEWEKRVGVYRDLRSRTGMVRMADGDVSDVVKQQQQCDGGDEENRRDDEEDGTNLPLTPKNPDSSGIPEASPGAQTEPSDVSPVLGVISSPLESVDPQAVQSQDGKDHNDQLDVTPGKFCCASPLSHFTPCTDFGSPVQADVDTPGTTVASPIDMEDATIYTNRLFGVGGSGDERNDQGVQQEIVLNAGFNTDACSTPTVSCEPPAVSAVAPSTSCRASIPSQGQETSPPGIENEDAVHEYKISADNATQSSPSDAVENTPGVLQPIVEEKRSQSKSKQSGEKPHSTLGIRRSMRLASKTVCMDLSQEERPVHEGTIGSDLEQPRKRKSTGSDLEQPRKRRNTGSKGGSNKRPTSGRTWVRESSPEPTKSGTSGRLKRLENLDKDEPEVQSLKGKV